MFCIEGGKDSKVGQLKKKNETHQIYMKGVGQKGPVEKHMNKAKQDAELQNVYILQNV